jgi:Flp pilus assembly protein TadD
MSDRGAVVPGGRPPRLRPESPSRTASPAPGTSGTKGPNAARQSESARNRRTSSTDQRRDPWLHPPVPQTGGPSRTGWAVAAGVFVLMVFYLPNLSYSSIAPQAATLLVLGAAGLPLLVVRATGLVPAQSPAQQWAARCAVGFVVMGALAVVLSAEPALSIVGQFAQPTGWLFMVGLGGCWALGTGLGSPERRLIETAILAGAAVNAVIAALQVLIGLNALDLPDYGSNPTGVFGNPVYLAAILAGSVALVGLRFVAEPKRYGPLVALFGLGIGMSGERLPGLLCLAVAGWILWRAWRQRGPSAESALTWRRAIVLGGLLVASLVGGSLLTALRVGGGLVNHAATSTASETFGQRISVWFTALHAIAAHPLLGPGPGQFLTATSPYFSESFTRAIKGANFLDAHDVVIEYATTIGLIGAGFLVAWVVLALFHRGGPLVGFALVLLATELAEPVNPVVTPLAFLALGASALALNGSRETPGAEVFSAAAPVGEGSVRRPRLLRLATVSMVLIALVPAVLYLVGGAWYQRATTLNNDGDESPALQAASNAESLLAPWPDPATLLGTIDLVLSNQGNAERLPAALRWARVAVDRDPTNARLWTLLADLQMAGGEPAAASASASTALKYEPWYPAATETLGVVAASRNERSAAEKWLDDSLAISRQPYAESVLRDLRRGCRASPLTPQQPTLQFTC